MIKEINVLGEKYSLIIADEKDEPRLKGCDGLCDDSSKKCVVKDYAAEAPSLMDKDNLALMQQKVIRHEIVHAFLAESGLSGESWGENEEIVDWIAAQGLKLYKAWQEAGAIDG